MNWYKELEPAGSGFWDYFDLADEMWDYRTGQRAESYLLDFDEEIVTKARVYAHEKELPWPPYRPVAEECINDMGRFESDQRRANR